MGGGGKEGAGFGGDEMGSDCEEQLWREGQERCLPWGCVDVQSTATVELDDGVECVKFRRDVGEDGVLEVCSGDAEGRGRGDSGGRGVKWSDDTKHDEQLRKRM